MNPCIPSPCGPNSLCQIANKSPSCTCMDNYIGSPPNCRSECTINSDCASNLACINRKCRDPCPGSCGLQTECHVYQHAAVCSCREGFTGNPFQSCYLKEDIGKFIYHTIHDIPMVMYDATSTYLTNFIFQNPFQMITTSATQVLVAQTQIVEMVYAHVDRIILAIRT